MATEWILNCPWCWFGLKGKKDSVLLESCTGSRHVLVKECERLASAGPDSGHTRWGESLWCNPQISQRLPFLAVKWRQLLTADCCRYKWTQMGGLPSMVPGPIGNRVFFFLLSVPFCHLIMWSRALSTLLNDVLEIYGKPLCFVSDFIFLQQLSHVDSSSLRLEIL